jgi:hypothetical protein
MVVRPGLLWPSLSENSCIRNYIPSEALAALARLQELPHDRACLFRLPGSIGLAQRDRPFHIKVDPRAEARGTRQHAQSQLQGALLHASVMRHPKRVPERKLDADYPRRLSLLGHRGHHRHYHRGDPRCLDPSCQHGHVCAAVGSSRGEDQSVGGLIAKVRHQLVSCFVSPDGKVALLVTHHGDVLGGCAADYAFGDELFEHAGG